jgi:hypothetical protein
MKISSALYTQSAQAIAEALFRAGQDLNGKNLRRASWQEIAEGLQDGKIASIIVQRLQMATTREDALHVLRIARKRVRVKKKSAGSRRLAAQSTPIVITDFFAQEDRDYQLYLECLRFEEEFEDAINPPGDFEEWKQTEGDWRELTRDFRIPGLRPASPFHHYISQYALQRMPSPRQPGALQNYLDHATYQELLQTITPRGSLTLSPENKARVALRAPNLLSRLSANTQDYSGLSPMQTGYELATLAMLREDYGLSFPLWLTDWGALANWYRKILRQARTRRKRTGCRILLYNPTRTGGGVTQPG